MRTLTLLSATLAIATATSAFAAGGDDDKPPKRTKTTTECTNGQIFDTKSKKCIDSKDQSFNDDNRYDAVRELAYAGAYDRATTIIGAADNPEDARFLNYRGFISRKIGNTEGAMVFYSAALEKAPDYHLARSYMGQGLVTLGKLDAAKMQLAEIAERGGKDTWAYAALDRAIGGQATDY